MPGIYFKMVEAAASWYEKQNSFSVIIEGIARRILSGTCGSDFINEISYFKSF